MRIKIPSLSSHFLFWGLGLVGLLADLFSKTAVFNWLSDKPFNQVSIIGNFLTFILRENPGAAFSIAHGQRILLTSLSLIAFIVVIMVFELGHLTNKLSKIVGALFFAGIGGNLYDRLFNNGLVRDFIDVNLYIKNYHWPTFNIADSLICIAVVICLLDVFFSKENEE
ncbi:MAG: signal peptidase II [Sedimentisphaeraceae bacterium JB056]